MWINRTCGEKLVGLVATRPVVLLTGARQTGKSSLLQKRFPDANYVTFDHLRQMEAAKEVGRHLKMEIRKYRRQGRVEVQFFLVDPNENYDLGNAVDQLSDQLSWGFANVFDIKGKIREME